MRMLLSYRGFFAVLAAGIAVSSNLILSPDTNPDWESYRRIFETGGSWLKDSGRDFVFTHIINIFKLVSPVPSYEAFRGTLVFLFAVFTWYFLSGRVIQYTRDRAIYIVCAFFVIGALRFTVQIREGIAVMLYLISLGLLQRSVLLSDRQNNIGKRWAYASFSWLVAILGAGVHTIGVLFLFGKFSSFVISKYTKSSLSVLMMLVWISLGFFLFALVFQSRLTDDLMTFALDRSGDRDLEAGSFTIVSLAYWLLHCLVFLYLYYLQKKAAGFSSFAPPQIYVSASIIAGPLTAISIVMIFWLKASDATPVVTVLFVRTFDAMIAMTLLHVSLFSKSKAGCLIVSFVLFLQVIMQLVWT